MSKQTGEYPLLMGGNTYTLKYDMRAISEIQEQFGLDALEQLADFLNLKVFAGIIAIGLMRHHEDMTADKVLDFNPPMEATAEIVVKAINEGYFKSSGGEATEKKK